jgi:predicted transcriptional regulator
VRECDLFQIKGRKLVMDDYELMFELSHSGRLNALRLLKEKPHRLKDLSLELELTSAEVSRHLGRLSEAQLITKDGDGWYTLTPFGGIILHEISNLGFLINNISYFSKHDLSVIPEELHGLNSLLSCELVEGTLEIMSMVGDVSKNAKRKIWVISDQLMRSMVELNVIKANEKLDVRLIYQNDAKMPDEYRPKKGMNLEVRLLEKVPLSMKLNEQFAGVVLPNLKRQIDYEFALVSKEKLFHRWAELLFNYFWQRAGPAF